MTISRVTATKIQVFMSVMVRPQQRKQQLNELKKIITRTCYIY